MHDGFTAVVKNPSLVDWLIERFPASIPGAHQEELLETSGDLREALEHNRREAIEAQGRTMRKPPSSYETSQAPAAPAQAWLRAAA